MNDRNAIAASRYFEDPIVGVSTKECIEAAEANGVSPETAMIYENDKLGCPQCPWRSSQEGRSR